MNQKYFVVSHDDAILHEGSEQECRAFLDDSTTREIAEAGALDLRLVSAADWMRRNGCEPERTPAHGGAECDQDGRQVLHDAADAIELPTEEERRAFWQHEHELTAWMQSLTPEQIDKLCNAGYYNDAMRGYLIAAAKEAGMDHDQQQALLNALRYCLDTLTKAEAEQLYMNF